MGKIMRVHSSVSELFLPDKEWFIALEILVCEQERARVKDIESCVYAISAIFIEPLAPPDLSKSTISRNFITLGGKI